MDDTVSKMDLLLLKMLEGATELNMGRGVECVRQVPVNGLQNRSYHDWDGEASYMVQGMGMRYMEYISLAVYIWSVEQEDLRHQVEGADELRLQNRRRIEATQSSQCLYRNMVPCKLVSLEDEGHKDLFTEERSTVLPD